MPETSQVTQVVHAIGRSEEGAAEKLLPLVYAELRHLAEARMAHEMAGQTFQPTALVHEAPDDKVLMVGEVLARLKEEDPELERIVVLQFFGGLSNVEAAESLGLATRTLDRQWAYARAWLFRYISNQT